MKNIARSRAGFLIPVFGIALCSCGAGGDRTSDDLSENAALAQALLPDVVVRAVAYSSATRSFVSVVRNQGTASTPSGTAIGVGYFCDDVYRTWGSVNGPLAPGAVVLIPTNGATFDMPPGTHTIRAWADDVNRFAESDETNNQRSRSITIDGAPPPSPGILWHDDIQAGVSPWGFSGLAIERPIGNEVSASDANGVNLSRTVDPLSGGGFALRHFAIFDDAGSRSQAGLWSFVNAAFGDQAKSAQGVWVAQEWYFPERITAGGDLVPWINLWDWHSTDAGGGNRWHTSPGLMLAEDGSMRVKWEWGGPAASINASSSLSTIALPVGKWFDVEMYYQWTTGATTLSLWINGALALQQSGVQTRAPSHANVETYVKFYGSRNGGAAWSPTPSIRYTRNVRVSNARIWH